MNEDIEKRKRYFEFSRQEMLQFFPDGIESVLEIGCGAGRFGALVKKMRGCRYTGVELIPEVAEQARACLDQVVVANIEDSTLPFEKQSFDCLVCNDVLEHLVDPWAALRNLVTYLKPSGYLVISLPNVRFSEVVKDLVFRKRWEYTDEGVLDRTHLRFFTESSARMLLNSCGIDVIKLCGINPIEYAWRLRFLNLMLLGAISDMRFPQYGILGRVKAESPVLGSSQT